MKIKYLYIPCFFIAISAFCVSLGSNMDFKLDNKSEKHDVFVVAIQQFNRIELYCKIPSNHHFITQYGELTSNTQKSAMKAMPYIGQVLSLSIHDKAIAGICIFMLVVSIGASCLLFFGVNLINRATRCFVLLAFMVAAFYISIHSIDFFL